MQIAVKARDPSARVTCARKKNIKKFSRRRSKRILTELNMKLEDFERTAALQPPVEVLLTWTYG